MKVYFYKLNSESIFHFLKLQILTSFYYFYIKVWQGKREIHVCMYIHQCGKAEMTLLCYGLEKNSVIFWNSSSGLTAINSICSIFCDSRKIHLCIQQCTVFSNFCGFIAKMTNNYKCLHQLWIASTPEIG